MKKYLLTGLIILLPVVLTLMVIIFLFDFFTEPFINIVGPLVDLLQDRIHIHFHEGLTLFLSRLFSLILLSLFILCLGFITQIFLVKTLMDWGNQILFKIPLIKTVYKVSRDIFAALLSSEGKKAFKNISSFKNNTNLNSSENPFSGLANMAKMMESFKQFNRK